MGDRGPSKELHLSFWYLHKLLVQQIGLGVIRLGGLRGKAPYLHSILSGSMG